MVCRKFLPERRAFIERQQESRIRAAEMADKIVDGVSRRLMTLPAGDSAWVVRVTTKGGILGTGIGDFALSSEGKLVCAPTGLQCPEEFQPSAFQSLVETVKSGTLQLPRVWVSYCSDCITRTITINRRDSMGVVHTYLATWDETTKSMLPKDVSRIYDAALALISEHR